jgi:flavin-dependent dehydrogenase
MNVAVVERKPFPREVICGEFLSYEVIRAIRHFGLYDEFLSLGPNKITAFRFTPENGAQAVQPLGFEAWSLKRSLLDNMLLQAAGASGATIIQPAEVTSINRMQDSYEVRCKTLQESLSLSAETVIGAYGKQSPLDKSLKRSFASKRSGMNGVKYHVGRRVFAEFPGDEIQLFAAAGVYCGVNRVNENEATLCFLTDGSSHTLRPIDALGVLLQKNRKFHALFRGDLPSQLLEFSAYGAGNIFFGKRKVVENGIYMVGDASAVIAPLAGDGIGMAIESGRLLAHVLTKAKHDSLGRVQTEALYAGEWKRLFRRRLTVASWLQDTAMKSMGGNLGGWLLKTFPHLAEGIIQWTRG